MKYSFFFLQNRYGLRLASHLSMEVEAESYVNSLAGFTLLGTQKLLNKNNIKAIFGILEIAMKDGNSLRRSWFQILKIVSELEFLLQIYRFLYQNVNSYGHSGHGIEGLDSPNYNNSDTNNNNNYGYSQNMEPSLHSTRIHMASTSMTYDSHSSASYTQHQEQLQQVMANLDMMLGDNIHATHQQV